jgi:hypothetical protein
MYNKLLCTALLLLIILFFISVLYERKYEHFASWTENRTEEKQKLENIENDKKLNNLIRKTVDDYINNLPRVKGPPGPIGPQGPSGTILVASGRLANKIGSFEDNDKDKIHPTYFATRTDGSSPSSSLSYMDNSSPFSPIQRWLLDVNQNIINKHDNRCLTMNMTKDGLYMSDCDKSNDNQKWNWDNTHRIISTTASDDKNLKCISLSKPDSTTFTTSKPGCLGKECEDKRAKRFLTVKNCDINNVQDNEVWSFI